jgi:hypothetical protein
MSENEHREIAIREVQEGKAKMVMTNLPPEQVTGCMLEGLGVNLKEVFEGRTKLYLDTGEARR